MIDTDSMYRHESILTVENKDPNKAYKFTSVTEKQFMLRQGQGWVTCIDPEVKVKFGVTAADGTKRVGDLILMEKSKEAHKQDKRRKRAEANAPIQGIKASVNEPGFSGKFEHTVNQRRQGDDD